MCGVQLKDQKEAKELVLMLGLNESLDQLAMTKSVQSYGDVLRWKNGGVRRSKDGHVLRREDGHVLKRALEFDAECQKEKWKRKNGRGKNIEETVLARMHEGWFEKGRCPLSIKVDQIAIGLR